MKMALNMLFLKFFTKQYLKGVIQSNKHIYPSVWNFYLKIKNTTELITENRNPRITLYFCVLTLYYCGRSFKT